MPLLLAGLAVFVGTHALSIFRNLRERLISALGGEVAYKAVYAVVSAAGLALIIYGFGDYRADGMTPLWAPPGFGRHAAMLLMLFAFILVVAAYVPSHIRSRTKHPMITGVMLWAIAHLLANGDAGSVMLFGTFLAWGIVARISMGKRTKTIFSAPSLGPLAGIRNDLVVIVSGTLLYAAFLLWGHEYLIGIPVASL
jgi:uncharacterized membrane protein